LILSLSIREDTAKYLINLDVNSAYYDPKTRSMRENPLRDMDPNDTNFAGDNFARYSGDAPGMAKAQMFAWQAADRGNEVHLQANPTQLALLHKQFEQQKEKVRDTNKGGILAKYGGEEHLQRPPTELLLAQSENYVEYSRTGKVVKGQERAVARSKYEEDGKFWMHE
jgi:pre-mRNA-processing factor SLU7